MKLNNIYKQVAQELNLSYEQVSQSYRGFWLFIKTSIEKLDLHKKLSEDEFNKLRTNFNIPSLGKLVCTYDYYLKIFKRIKNKENVKNKED